MYSSLLFSQGEYLDKGQSGLGFSWAYSSNKDASAIGALAGFSVYHVVDLAVSASSVSYVQKLGGYDLSGVAISPSITFYALKRNEEEPISFSMTASYEHDSYSSMALDNANATMDAYGYSIGASLFGAIKLTPSMRLQPTVGATFLALSSELKELTGGTTSESTTILIEAGCSFIIQFDVKGLIVIEPSIGIDKQVTTFGVQAGYVFIL